MDTRTHTPVVASMVIITGARNATHQRAPQTIAGHPVESHALGIHVVANVGETRMIGRHWLAPIAGRSGDRGCRSSAAEVYSWKT